jgi:hypothetical protein
MGERQVERRLRTTAERFENVKRARDGAIRDAAGRRVPRERIAELAGLSRREVDRILAVYDASGGTSSTNL